MMLVGYSDSESDSYRMWNRKTNQIVTTREVIWMKRLFFDRPTHLTAYVDATYEVKNETDDPNPNKEDNEIEAAVDDVSDDKEEEESGGS